MQSTRTLALLTLASAGIMAVSSLRPHAVTTERRDPVYAGMVGRWQGTVEVRDERVASRRRTRPTEVRVSAVPESDGLSLHVTTKDGADNSVTTETDLLQLDKSLTAAQFGGMGDSEAQHYDVTVADSLTANSPLRLVLEREQSEDDMTVTIRETVTIAPGEIRIVQEMRMFGQEFEFQREYVLRRIG